MEKMNKANTANNLQEGQWINKEENGSMRNIMDQQKVQHNNKNENESTGRTMDQQE